MDFFAFLTAAKNQSTGNVRYWSGDFGLASGRYKVGSDGGGKASHAVERSTIIKRREDDRNGDERIREGEYPGRIS